MLLREKPLHILFVNYHHLDSNSGIHIFNLANQLTNLGVKCTVCVPDQKETANILGHCDFDLLNFNDARQHIVHLEGIDLIHAWTPRENVRAMTESLADMTRAPYIVHLEDNEDAILAASLGMPVDTVLNMPEKQLNSLVPHHLSHPFRYRQFLKKAKGLTMVMDTLQVFCPEVEAKEVIWPGYEEGLQWHLPSDAALRQRLQIDAQEYVVVYTGNVHSANRDEVFSLYLAVGLLNRHGVRTRLVRTGTDHVRLYDSNLNMLDQYCISLGHVARADLPSILSIADALVQPGREDEFNTYRFPSKLPEYLASGKPVLLPKTNIGRYVQNEKEAVILDCGNALEIAKKLEALFPDHERRERIGNGGRLFAENNLKWSRSAKKLHGFYEILLNTGQ
jgi:glycosyltransferase involved in cell wall biosynthesis